MRFRLRTSLTIVLLCYATTGLGLEKISAHPTKGWLMDTHGRVRIFHGVNAVQKRPPWYPAYLLDNARMQDFKRWGLNIVRLGTMWSGVQPSEGYYNDTYTSLIDNIVQRLADHGIYTLLDMHQDVLTSRIGESGYDGVPRWIVDKFPEPEHPWPWPMKTIDQWELGYLTEAVSFWYQLFYNNYHGTLYKWVDFWDHIAKRFHSHDSVIGYNLINEPWVGNYIEDKSLLLPSVCARRNLLPAYDKVNSRIRHSDPDTIIFYEPTLHGQAFERSGFNRVPGGNKYRRTSAYSFHMYCWLIEFMPPSAGDTLRQMAVEGCKRWLLPKMFKTTMANIRRTGGAAMLTEFGLCKTWEERVDVDCRTFLDLADDYLMSWIEWDHSDGSWYDGEVPRMEKVSHFVRTYARAIAGEPVRMKYDATTHHFVLEYDAFADMPAPTEIFVPALNYPSGYNVVAEGEHLKYTAHGDTVYIEYSGSSTTRVIVQISHSD